MHKVILMDVLQGGQEAVDKAAQLCYVSDADKGTHWLQSDSHIAALASAKCFPLFWHGMFQLHLHSVHLQHDLTEDTVHAL